MSKNINTGEISVGVIGLGLMGSSIVASFLLAGHPVKAIAPLPKDLVGARERIQDHLRHCLESKFSSESIQTYMDRLTITEDYNTLARCGLVQECVIEIPEIKENVYKKVIAVVDTTTIIASNTSAIPISALQKYVTNPERFMGIHWAEPAYLTRFLEIVCGEHTSLPLAKWVRKLAQHWGKEPTLLRKDIRGFITNRLMYAVYREGLSLVEKGDATMEDVDKAFRYDAGSWMTMMGVFRRMDYLGLPDCLAALNNIFPTLNNDEKVPLVMQKMVDSEARGIHNLKGLFPYSEDEARQWEEAFALFNQDIFKLAAKYPSEIDRIS